MAEAAIEKVCTSQLLAASPCIEYLCTPSHGRRAFLSISSSPCGSCMHISGESNTRYPRRKVGFRSKGFREMQFMYEPILFIFFSSEMFVKIHIILRDIRFCELFANKTRTLYEQVSLTFAENCILANCSRTIREMFMKCARQVWRKATFWSRNCHE